MNKDDVLTADADNVLMVVSGVFTGTPAAGLTKTDLIKTTTRSQLVDSMMASFGATQIANDFKASGTQYPLAIRLAGRFKTAFPGGKPKPAQPEPRSAEAGRETRRRKLSEGVHSSDHRCPGG